VTINRFLSERRKAQARRALEVVRTDGLPGLKRRAIRDLYGRFGASEPQLSLLPEDIADSTKIELCIPETKVPRDRQLVVGWLTTPPRSGSGGHTTMFRMVEAVEAAGHRCVLLLSDRHGGEATRHAEIIRRAWPRIRAEVRDVDEGFVGLDACVATAWQTAHTLAARNDVPLRYLYLVQDFEPFFYPRGLQYALAEDSYRFGFRCVTIGYMAAELLKSELDVPAEVAPFGCDTDVYHLINTSDRSGVVFYTKPDVERRGYLLGVHALAEFSKRHPEQEIHVFGDAPARLPFPATRHQSLSPAELNTLYNSTIAGFAFSFTNISLVAEEMLASGTIPVINDSSYARADLHNPYACWTTPTPAAVADALSALVESPDISRRAVAASGSVHPDKWTLAQRVFLRALEEAVYK
jgi:glycosyltransferase involved in cell wall biosynthesis